MSATGPNSDLRSPRCEWQQCAAFVPFMAVVESACGAPSLTACAYRPQRSRLTISTEGCFSSQRATLSTLRSSRNNRATLKIDHDSPVSRCSPPTPIVQANDPGWRRVSCSVAFELSQDRIVTDPHSETPHQTLTRASSSSRTQVAGNLRCSRGPASIGNCDRGRLIGECPASAVLGSASPVLIRSSTATVSPCAG